MTGFTLRRKTEDDRLKEELLEYIEYFNMNHKLAICIKNIKDLIILLNIQIKQYNSFDTLSEKIVNSINTSNITNLEKANLLIKYNNFLSSLYRELEQMRY